MSANTLLKHPPIASLIHPSPPADDLPIVGITPFTTIDYPGRLSAVLYTQGCAWSCRYCHNTHLRPTFSGEARLEWLRVKAFLKSRINLLEAVVFSGGEPTLHEGLFAAMEEVKKSGFLVGLHTAGMNPAGLERVLPLCDWVGMDIKSALPRYEEVTGVANSGGKAYQSARLVLASHRPYEFRTTVHPALQTPEDIEWVASMLSRMGVKEYVLQRFRPIGCEDKTLCEQGSDHAEFWESLRALISPYFKAVHIRG